VTRTIWLASYPKSGNTWLRMLLAGAAQGGPLDINDLAANSGIASARSPFDQLTLIDSGLLTYDEVDALRPCVHEHLARGIEDDAGQQRDPAAPVRFVKTHDAYTLTPRGEPLLAGAGGASGAIVIVRDPRDVAPSLAHHAGGGIDAAIDFMADHRSAFCDKPARQHNQLRQKLLSWSDHVESWLDQTDIPVLPIRYEDMIAETSETLRQALTFSGLTVAEADIAHAVDSARFTALSQQEQVHGFREAPRRKAAGAFFRRGQAGAWRDELSPDQVARLEAEHAPVMLRLGYALTATGGDATGRARREPSPRAWGERP